MNFNTFHYFYFYNWFVFKILRKQHYSETHTCNSLEIQVIENFNYKLVCKYHTKYFETFLWLNLHGKRFNSLYTLFYLQEAAKESEAGAEMSALVNYVQPVRFKSFEYAESTKDFTYFLINFKVLDFQFDQFAHRCHMKLIYLFYVVLNI